MAETRLVESESGGLVPDDDGWFVVNAREARWLEGDLARVLQLRSGSRGAIPAARDQPEPAGAGRADDDVSPRGGAGGLPRALRRMCAHRRGRGAPAAAMGLLPLPGRRRPCDRRRRRRPSLVLAVGARSEESRGSVFYPADPAARRRHGRAASRPRLPDPAVRRMRGSPRRGGPTGTAGCPSSERRPRGRHAGVGSRLPRPPRPRSQTTSPTQGGAASLLRPRDRRYRPTRRGSISPWSRAAGAFVTVRRGDRRRSSRGGDSGAGVRTSEQPSCRQLEGIDRDESRS